MPLMFALARVLVIALVMALVDGLRTEPLIGMSLFGLPNGRTDWRATYTASGSEAAMPLMFANFLRRLTIPEPWHSDFDGLHASRSCRSWTASRTANRNWIANRLSLIHI